ncbi:MAG TPA: hypothetical protein VGM18_15980 [Candidatus Sulfotelmatobacter sp.]|jgi:hypothetical protein
MSTEGFKIFVSDLSSSAEEWKQALSASDSELPELTDEQKKWVRRFGVAEKEYARGVLAGTLGQERTKNKGKALGRLAEEILEVLGTQYKLVAVLWQGSRLRWLLRIEAPERIYGVPVSFEMADDVLESGILTQLENLKTVVFAGVGRSDRIVNRT